MGSAASGVWNETANLGWHVVSFLLLRWQISRRRLHAESDLVEGGLSRPLRWKPSWLPSVSVGIGERHAFRLRVTVLSDQLANPSIQ